MLGAFAVSLTSSALDGVQTPRRRAVKLQYHLFACYCDAPDNDPCCVASYLHSRYKISPQILIACCRSGETEDLDLKEIIDESHMLLIR